MSPGTTSAADELDPDRVHGGRGVTLTPPDPDALEDDDPPSAEFPRFKRRTMDGVYFVLGMIAFFAILFLPMILLQDHDSTYVNPLADSSLEVTVGLGAILRTMMRRFFRAGARTLFSTVAATLTRAIARVITRRFVRSSVRTLAWSQANARAANLRSRMETQSPGQALTTGTLAIFVSFWAVLLLLPPEESHILTQGSDLRALGAAAIAAMPLLVNAFVTSRMARRWGVDITISTRVDGLLIQGYFTGAGSFLPITTDIEHTSGGLREKAWVSGMALTTMALIGTVTKLLYFLIPWWGLDFASAMFLLYAFVYAFPMRPLDGHDVWSYSRRAWAGLFTVILLVFQSAVSDELTFFL